MVKLPKIIDDHPTAVGVHPGLVEANPGRVAVSLQLLRCNFVNDKLDLA
jgi:hypothetical protein